MATTSKPERRSDTGLPPAYNPADHETRIREQWDAAGSFHADPRKVADGKPPYCILIPPPNVTGALHLGHALNNTLQDILVRMHRMKGFEALWMPGTDHAGIATQTVVDKRLQHEGQPSLKDYKRLAAEGKPARELFIEKVQEWKDEYEARIINQLKLMGCSCDWKRLRFTMDEFCASAVREAFFRLFQAGLIYRGKRLVNWDPVTQTALADDEVEMREVEGKFYYLRYPLVDAKGEPDTAQISPGLIVDSVTVATTRPETYLGDTAVAMNPNDPRAAALRGKYIKLPLVERVIPIVEDDYVVLPDPESSDAKAKYATGFLKVTPAHDENDYQLGRRHNLDIINVMAPDASISDQHGWSDVGDAGIFVGLSREDARGKVVAEFKARGLLEDIKPYSHSVGHSYRSHAPIEPYLSDQWYVKVTDDRLAGSAQRAVVSEQQSGNKWVNANDTRVGGTGVSPVIRQDLVIHERNLPHWQKGGHTYFVTFRLNDGSLSTAEREIVADACVHWHGDRAKVHVVTVMPDHVHLLLTPLQRQAKEWWPLQEIVQSIKSYTAHEINKRRGTSGRVWQTEYFDRIVRDEDEYNEKWRYIALNAVKAGLVTLHSEYAFTRIPSQSGEDGRDARPTAVPSPHDHTMTFHPSRYARTYEAWHENIRDWCISRQLWWGHRIPVWSGPRNELPELDGSLASQQIFGDQAYVCVRSSNDQSTLSKLESAGFTQDPDVLDTWFSSALWPLSTLGWPDEDQHPQFKGLLDAFKPTSVLCTARDIITLWVSRMVMFNRFFSEGQIPFRDVYIHPVIQDGDGKRMSKSAGNGVDPLDIIDSHGADAMRFTLCQLASQTQDVRMPVERDERTGRNTSPKFDLGKRFCNKLWNASRFTMMMLAEADPIESSKTASPVRAEHLTQIDRWMLSRLAYATARIENAIASYEFNVYADTMYDLLWNEFCDWYLEAVKPTVKSNPAQQAVLRASLNCILRLLHPIAPFVTEAIYEELRRSPGKPLPEGLRLGDEDGWSDQSRQPAMLCVAAWPRFADALRDESLETHITQLQELVRTIRDTRSQQQAPPRKKAVLHTSASLAAEIAAAGGFVETLAVLENVTTDEPTGASVPFTFAAQEHRLSGLTEATDTGAERERLTRSLTELEQSILALEKRLANPGYADKAPAHLVQQTRDQLTAKQSERDAVKAALEALA